MTGLRTLTLPAGSVCMWAEVLRLLTHLTDLTLVAGGRFIRADRRLCRAIRRLDKLERVVIEKNVWSHWSVEHQQRLRYAISRHDAVLTIV